MAILGRTPSICSSRVPSSAPPNLCRLQVYMLHRSYTHVLWPLAFSQILADAQTQSFILLDLLFELRGKILINSVILPDGVYPRERDSAPGTFTHTYTNRLDGRQYTTEETPVAIQLGLTCKQLLIEAIQMNLFYKHNQFRFIDPVFAHTYLRKIIPITYDGHRVNLPRVGLHLQPYASCQPYQHLQRAEASLSIHRLLRFTSQNRWLGVPSPYPRPRIFRCDGDSK